MTGDEKYNERLKLIATAINNIAVAFIVIGAVTPIAAGHVPGTPAGLVPLVWVLVGIILHMVGQYALGDLR